MKNGKKGKVSRATLALEKIAATLEKTGGRSGNAGNAPEDGAKAFSWTPDGGFRTVARPARVDPGMFVGIDEEREAFYTNAARHLAGKPALDTLLWGERGTGKTSLAASLLTKFQEPGWGIVHVREAHLAGLSALVDALAADARRWFILLDDLTLDARGEDYHELKVFLEGGIEERPENVLAVATSNRRHLVPERFPDSGAIHPDEDAAEATSLADRFGLSLGFFAMDQETWLAAVESHLRRFSCTGEREEWRIEAIRWAMEKGIRSGRSAVQFAKIKAGGG